MIFYNINQSEFIVEMERFKFFFSSMLYLTKFKERCLENRDYIRDRLASKYGIEIEASDYFDIILYSEIEKRGFKVVAKNGDVYTCLKEITLNGEIKTLQSCNV